MFYRTDRSPWPPRPRITERLASWTATVWHQVLQGIFTDAGWSHAVSKPELRGRSLSTVLPLARLGAGDTPCFQTQGATAEAARLLWSPLLATLALRDAAPARRPPFAAVAAFRV